MEDREVGELWSNSAYCCDDHSCQARGKNGLIEQLIRKLVEERALYHYGHTLFGSREAAYRDALRDFGIDPQTWKEGEEK